MLQQETGEGRLGVEMDPVSQWPCIFELKKKNKTKGEGSSQHPHLPFLTWDEGCDGH